MYWIVRCTDRVVSIAAALLILVMLLYSAYTLWYSSSLKNGSFISDELAQYRPDGDKPTLEDLMKLNPDVISWITVNGTHIDYPVVQGKDDTEYLNKDVLGGFSFAGAIFLSSLNNRDFSDPYNIVYGHHIEGGAMFTDILEFRDASYFESHPYGTLWYNGSADRIEIFACTEVSAADEIIYCDPGLITEEDLPKLISYIRSESTQFRDLWGVFHSSESVDNSVAGSETFSGERIVALSTCEDAVSYDRVLLFGRLRPMTDEEIAAAEAEEKDGAGSEDDRSFYNRYISGYRTVLTSVLALISLLLLIVIIRLVLNNNNKKSSR